MTALIRHYPRRIIAMIAVIGVLWILVTAPQRQSRAQSNNADSQTIAPVVGAIAPDFVLQTPAGKTVKLSDFRGKGVLVNFWATWCIPCRSEMPTMQAMYASKRDQGFEIVAVNMSEGTNKVSAFSDEYGLTFPIVIDASTTANAYRVVNIPSSFFVDANGVIRAVYVGPMSRSVMNASLDAILPQP